jgi:hypothetical protein
MTLLPRDSPQDVPLSCLAQKYLLVARYRERNYVAEHYAADVLPLDICPRGQTYTRPSYELAHVGRQK